MEKLKQMLIPERPEERADFVLDTDTYNEIDDQYALAYMLCCGDKLNVKAICAAPFYNHHSEGPADGMERSYQEILHLLSLMGREDLTPLVFRGSERYLPNEEEAVESPAAREIARLAMEHTQEEPLYVGAIGAITNVASAILMEPAIRERMVVIWLGGHAQFWPHTKEFNMMQDVAAARVVFGCGVRLVQLPCMGAVSGFTVSEADLVTWLRGKNALCDYLVQHTIDEVTYAAGKPWTRVIWDVTAVAWLTGDFEESVLIPSPIPTYDNHYASDPTRHLIRCVYYVNRDALIEDLFTKLSSL